MPLQTPEQIKDLNTLLEDFKKIAIEKRTRFETLNIQELLGESVDIENDDKIKEYDERLRELSGSIHSQYLTEEDKQQIAQIIVEILFDNSELKEA